MPLADNSGVSSYAGSEPLGGFLPGRKKIGISVSDQGPLKSLTAIQQRYISGELAKHLMRSGANIVYGGDLQPDGYTYRFSGAVSGDNKYHRSGRQFANYLAWPVHSGLRSEDEIFFAINGIRIVKSAPPSDLPVLLTTAVPAERRYYEARCFSAMRHDMISHCDARICTGGRLSDYAGFYPGIIEEAFLSLKNRQPLFILGAFGGASRILIRAIKGESAQTLFLELTGQFSSLSGLYGQVGDSARYESTLMEMLDAFSMLGIKGLSALNRLSVQENEMLFTSASLPEILRVVKLGLRRSFS